MGLPQFTSTFIDTLKQMQAATNPTRQKLLFKKFYDSYGTHYITEVSFLSKLGKAVQDHTLFFSGTFWGKGHCSDKD